MRLFRFEWEKMMLRQRGLLILIVYFILQLAVLAVTDAPYHEERMTFGEQYQKYLEQVRGKYTEEKGNYLEREAEKIERAEERIVSVRQDYYDGKISEKEYEQERQEISEILKNKNGFEALYEQYLYVCEGKGNHYFLDDNGWSGLLSDNHPDFLLILALVLLVTPVLCREYETQMDVLMLTSRQGRESRRAKVFLSLTVSLLMGLGSSLMELAFYSVKYGLPDGSFPLQSAEYFGNSTTAFSLWQTWLAGTGMQILGCLLLVLEILFFASLVKKVALTVLAVIASAVLPYLGLNSGALLRLPLPVSFLMGADFWKGSQYQADEVSGKDVLIYREVTGREMMILLAVAAVIVTIFAAAVTLRNRNQYDGVGKKSLSVRAGTFLALLMAGSSFVLVGCSARGEMERGGAVCYNVKTAEEYRDDSLCISFPENGGIPILSGENGVEEELVKSPLLSMGKGAGGSADIKGVFGDGSGLYYMKEETERQMNRVGRYHSDVATVSIVRVDQKSRQEEIIFEKDVSYGKSVLGIEYAVNNRWEFLSTCSRFFLNDSYLFFLDSENRIRQVDRETGEITLPDIQWNDNIAFDGERIYFQDEEGMLCAYCIEEGKTERYEKVMMSSFYLQGKYIYYVNCLDQDKLYRFDLQTKETEKIVDCSAIYVTSKDGGLIYTEKGNGEDRKLNK